MPRRGGHIRCMSNAPQMAEVAALVGDPARANILCALLGGRALTATELAFAAGVTPQTTSGHLAKLAAARLLVPMKQGRHRYYRLAGPHVGQMLESIMNVALEGPPRFQPKSHLDDKLRHARTCYDHIAGALGVGLADRLIECEHVILGDEAGEVTPLRRGILKQARRRSVSRPCQASGVLPAVPGLDRTPPAYRRRRRRGVVRPVLRAEMDRTGARWPRADDYACGQTRPYGSLFAPNLTGLPINISATDRMAALIAWMLFVRVDDLVKDGAICAVTRVFDALWRRRLRRSSILDILGVRYLIKQNAVADRSARPTAPCRD